MAENYNYTQEVVLPSRGLLNPEIPGGKVVQRCMMVTDQKFLSGSNQSAGSVLHQLIQRTVVSPEGFDVSNLTLADTLYLLFKLRILSYGKDYRFKTRCPECRSKIDVELDLSELPVEILDENFAEKLVATLPHRGDKVYTKILTNADREEINKEILRRKKKRPDDESEYVLRIAYSIDKVVFAKADSEGKKEITNMTDIERYVASLTDLDASAIIAARDSVAYGIAPIVEHVCSECGEYIDVSVQFSSEFFRPHFSR